MIWPSKNISPGSPKRCASTGIPIFSVPPDWGCFVVGAGDVDGAVVLGAGDVDGAVILGAGDVDGAVILGAGDVDGAVVLGADSQLIIDTKNTSTNNNPQNMVNFDPFISYLLNILLMVRIVIIILHHLTIIPYCITPHCIILNSNTGYLMNLSNLT